MMHVVCVGDLMVDVVAQLPGSLATGSDTPALISFSGGGAAANVAAWLVAAGASATFVGRIGDDTFGLRAVEELTAAGVEPVVTIDPARPTGTCIVLVNDSGERTMIPCAGANDAPGDAGLLPASADWLYLSGYALLNEGSRGFGLAALEVARGRGWSVAVDAASAAPLATVGADTFLEWAGPDVLLFANADEALVLTGLTDPAAAAQKLAVRCGAAVVKRGVEGAVWSDGSAVRSVPAVSSPVVDSTGAGDAFAAGFLATAGEVEAALRRGVSLAARAVAKVGARP
ncbi:MAG TPA: carbohydrate kinase family protein [Jatrophihabitans sp.]|nr:carbohydrate kinase family protein [Jatrophihabitans sp.]